MRRRQVLALLGSGFAAGCVGPLTDEDAGSPTPTLTVPKGSPSGTPTGDATATPDATPTPGEVTLAFGETYTTAGGSEVTLADPGLSKAVTTPYIHTEIWNLRGRQFVTFEVRVDGDVLSGLGAGPEAEDYLVPRVDGRVPEAVPSKWVHRTGEGPGDRLYVAVSFPVTNADRAAVVWPRANGRRVAWELPGDPVAGLATAPRFAVRTYAMTVGRGSDGDGILESFTLTVENVGDADGRFVGLVEYPDGTPFETVSFRVPAGETRTKDDLSPGEAFADCADPPTLYLGGRGVEPDVTCPGSAATATGGGSFGRTPRPRDG